MSARSFFTILFKIFALILLTSSVRALIISIQSIVYYFVDFQFVYIAIATVVLLIFGLFIYALLFKADYIIDKLKLTNGIDETISLNIHRSDLLSLAIVILGGYILVEEIPVLCQALFNYYQEGRMEMGYSNASPKYIVYSIMRILIALILLGNTRLIVNFIELRRKK